MKEILELVEKMPQEVQQWADLLTLLGVSGGIVFSFWIVGGLVADLTRPLFRRPNAKLKKGKHRA